MDVIYIGVFALFWLAIYGLARGCMRLQKKGDRS